MKNRNLLIGAGVIVVGYLLYKKILKSKEMKCNGKYYNLQLKNSERFQAESYVSPEQEMNRKRQWMAINCK